MFKKAQAATEYLIILAVVIIIALIVIGVMGGIPGLGTAGKSKVSESYWAGQSVGVESYAIDTNGKFKFILKNNGRNSVTITRIAVGNDPAGGFGLGTFCTSAPCSGFPSSPVTIEIGNSAPF